MSLLLRDGWLLFATRFVRLFAGPTLTLAGDTVVSLWVTTRPTAPAGSGSWHLVPH